MSNIIFDENIQMLFDKVKSILKTLKFSDEQIVKQMKDLGEVIIISVFIRLLNEKDKELEKGILDQEKISKFLEENYSKEEVKQIFQEEAEKIIREYFKEILKDASQEDLVEIENILKTLKID